MTKLIPETSLSARHHHVADHSERGELKKFLHVSCRFIVGLVIVVAAADWVMGIYLEKSGHRGGIAPDVQRAIDNVDRDPQTAQIIILGDSVARQFFPHNGEPSDEVRFLTTSRAVSMAGQYYLAQKAMRRCGRLTDIYLVMLPSIWRNNMPRLFTHDYFCGHFHTPAQVAEVFWVKRDIELSFAHLGRCLLPNLMAANSLSQPASAVAPGAADAKSAPGDPFATDPERLLLLLSEYIGPAAAPELPAPPGKSVVYLSPVSRYYLEKLKGDCQRRGIRLHVLPCPVSAEKNGFEFVDQIGIYDGPIINDVPANQVIDRIHFQKSYVAPMRKRMTELYHLDFLVHPGGGKK